MPELPDITIYIEALERRIVGKRLEAIRFTSPFVLRTVTPSNTEFAGAFVTGIRRLGKRIVFALEGELFIIIHPMIAGRLRWLEPGARAPARIGLAAFEFADGTLLLTEAGSKKRAAIHLIAGEKDLADLNPGGVDLFETDLGSFAAILRSGNHTLKRSLTDPRNFSGIGNAYSDEILHAARLSPIKLTSKLTGDEIERLFTATLHTLNFWIERLRKETGEGFPEKVTAFRPDMAVHGRYGKPCLHCGSPVQRIVYAGNETNYCAPCQTGGRLLADRALSRLLREDWPRSIEEMEEKRMKN